MQISYNRLLIFLIALLVLLLGAFTLYKWKGNFDKTTFAYEYGHIATNVAGGNGYINVFSWDDYTGETAWCPPGYVGYFVAVFKVFGIRSVAAHWALLTLRVLMFALIFYWIATLKKGNSLFALIVFVILLLYANYVIRQSVDDVTLNILLSAFTLNIFVRYWTGDLRYGNRYLLLLAVLLPVCNISLMLGLFCFIVCLILFKRNTFRSNLKPLIGTVVIVLILAVGWGVRNQNKVGGFYPFKSNLWFEFHLSNVVNPDGLIKASDFYRFHPGRNMEIRDEYKTLGEKEFIDLYTDRSHGWLKDNPDVFIKKIWNRFSDAFIYLTNFNDLYEIDPQRIKDNDLDLLRNEGLVVEQYWSFFDLNEAEVSRQLDELQLTNREDIEIGIHKARSSFEASNYYLDNWKGVLRSLLFSTFPFIIILASLLMRSIRTNIIFLFCLMLYLLTIMPYVIISFYHRYEYFQITFFVVFMSLFFHWLLSEKFKVRLSSFSG